MSWESAMDEFDDWDEDDEVEVRIEPRDHILEENKISQEEFEDALATAIDEYHEQIDALADGEEIPSIGSMTVRVAGTSFRLDELAEVQVSDESE